MGGHVEDQPAGRRDCLAEPTTNSHSQSKQSFSTQPVPTTDGVILPSSEELANLLPLAKMAAVLPNRQRNKLIKQRNLFLEQAEALRTIVKQHIHVTGTNPLQPVLEADLKSLHAQKTNEGVAGAEAIVSTSPAAKSSSLTPEAEACLLAHFSLQDTLTREEAAALARHARCTEQQVRAYFLKLRGTVHRFVERMQKRASAAKVVLPSLTNREQPAANVGDDGDGDRVASEAVVIDPATQSWAKVSELLDNSGGIIGPEKAGPFAVLMLSEKSMDVRSKMLEAIHKTGRAAILSKLAMAGGLLETLERWAKEAEADRQTTLLLHLLRVCNRLPVTSFMLKTSTLLKTVAKLQKYKIIAVARAADAVIQHWRNLDDSFKPAKSTSKPTPAVASTTAAPQANRAAVLQQLAFASSTTTSNVNGTWQQPNSSSAAAYHIPAQRQAQPAVRVKSNPSRPLSADEIVKAKKKAKLAATYGLKSSEPPITSTATAFAHGAGFVTQPVRPSSLQVQRPPSVPLNLPRPPAPVLQQVPVFANPLHTQAPQDPRQQRSAAQPTAVQASPAAMQKTTVSYRCPPPANLPSGVQLVAGEESVERVVQQTRDEWEPETTYATRANIPPDPEEAFEAEDGNAPPVSIVPFVPQDTLEAVEQDAKLRAAGVALPQYLQQMQLPAPPFAQPQLVPMHMPHVQQVPNQQMQYFPPPGQYILPPQMNGGTQYAPGGPMPGMYQ